ncbi:MFS transporter [Phyllobacterium zundukense]|uniref:MFS transporter n=1 Tax=Phyllobacterium zundukense TaxID=1867719 RepID=A0ACD4CYF5_9HYPH|nr:MFS transporter [Phyllobacterium zundukense]UXN58495.1 MFS transporter [Phyllobacterium zundukense]
MTGPTRTAGVVILTAATFGLTYGLSAPLIALELSDAGYSETLVGANSAMYAIGVLLVAPALPHLSRHLGFGKLAKCALLLAGALFAVFPTAPFLWWFPLRAALGAAAEALFVVSETWLNQITSEEKRGKTIAIYVTALSAGTALGPGILALVGRDEALAFVIGAVLTLAACVVLQLGRPREAKPERAVDESPFRYLKRVPVAVAAAALNAALESAGLSLLPLYAIQLGWPEQSATFLLTVLLIGSILLQLPIGWLGDRMNRRILVVILAAISAAGALVWPAALAHAWLAYPLLFVWGGAFVGIYTITIAILGDRYEGGELVSVYALLSIAWGLGALAGPLIGGMVMEVSSRGLPIFAAAACGLFAIFAGFNNQSPN